MIYLATGLIVVWVAGLLFLVGRAFNFSRLALNNPVSDKPYWDYSDYVRFYIHVFRRQSIFGLAVAPAKLTEAGKQYQEKAIRIEWIMLAWLAAGVVLIVWASSCFMAS
jgi:hypothetical protein